MTASRVDTLGAIDACGEALWHCERASELLIRPGVACCSVEFMDSQVAIDAADKMKAAERAVARLRQAFERSGI